MYNHSQTVKLEIQVGIGNKEHCKILEPCKATDLSPVTVGSMKTKGVSIQTSEESQLFTSTHGHSD